MYLNNFAITLFQFRSLYSNFLPICSKRIGCFADTFRHLVRVILHHLLIDPSIDIKAIFIFELDRFYEPDWQ